jgi:plasmid maintenance system antidote protein VapI/Zn-dependent peptidase ImmA (M78 family)
MAEAAFTPEWFSKPSDTLRSLMSRKGISANALAERAGWQRSFVAELLSGSEAIDDQIAQELARQLGGTPAFWLRRQSQFEEQLVTVSARVSRQVAVNWLRTLPVKEMREQGWLRTTASHEDAFRASLAYFDVATPEEWQDRYGDFANDFRFKSSPTFESKVGALAAWLRQGELQTELVATGPWNREKFRRGLLEIRELSRSKNPDSFVPKLREACSALGVAIAFVKAPQGCRASGASRFVNPSRALMILSFRYLSDDHFWFAFFHEAAHLILHGEGKTFIDGDIAAPSREEDEANAFSAGVLVPTNRFEEMISLPPRVENIIRFARSIGVSPGIVVGQMQHHKALGPNQMNGLKRRFSWDQITQAAA